MHGKSGSSMTPSGARIGRRAFLGSLAALAALPGRRAQSQSPHGRSAAGMLTKAIPASGEALPVIGMGSWITFNVGDDAGLRAQRVDVLRAFFDAGGAVIDSSPMYGTSEEVIGHCLARIESSRPLFAATKVWTPLQMFGPGQMEDSRAYWGIERFDLMQVHNLLNWDGHLETLREDKAAGRIRYIGITTSHGRRHRELERIMLQEPLDAVQLTYNIVDREAERRLLPLAAERGLAVIANRPFRRKQLFTLLARHPLPGWAAEIDCTCWAQVFLKFIVSHPAVTCAIPATSRVDHMQENMGALYGRLPDAALRARMVRDVEDL